MTSTFFFTTLTLTLTLTLALTLTSTLPLTLNFGTSTFFLGTLTLAPLPDSGPQVESIARHTSPKEISTYTSPVPRPTDLRHTTPPSVQIWHIIEVWKIALFVSSVLKHFFREFRISLSHSILSQSCRATVEFVVDIIYTFDAKTCQTKRQMSLRI